MRTLLLAIVLIARCAYAADPIALNVRDFGAKGDGQTDDTAAFQKALDTAGKDGSRVFVPAGKFLIKGQLNVPDFVTLDGSFTAPERTFDSSNNLANTKGSILFTTAGKDDEKGKPFIT